EGDDGRQLAEPLEVGGGQDREQVARQERTERGDDRIPEPGN
ncbi:MAG: hypothetical protein JWP03_2370, partial [Phycisphaerales bacterium]|nr:hypothetical protein [Phycisphaerales bacterium]